MRALLCTIALLQAGTHARMATPCRAGTDHCRLVNTQKSIRAAADRARKSAAEAKDAVRMSRATSVAREAAVRARYAVLAQHAPGDEQPEQALHRGAR